MPRPFATTLTRSRMEGELRIDLAFAGDATDDQRNTLRLLLGEIAAFARCGALGGHHVDPNHVSAQAAPPTVTAQEASQRFSEVRLDAGAVACFLNMAEWTHHHVLPLETVRIAWDHLPERGAAATAIDLPGAWPARQFQLDLDDERDRRFAIEMNLAQAQPAPVLQQINEDLFVWYTGANRGAYGSEGGFPPAQSFIYFSDDPVQSLPDQITWFIDAFHCAEAALDGLANTLHRIHHTRAAFTHVKIG